MDADTFRSRVAERIAELAAEFAIGNDKAFLAWAGSLIFRMDEEDAYQASVIGGKNDVGLDFGYVDDTEERIILAQGKYSPSLPRDAIRSLSGLPAILADPAKLRALNANKEVTDFTR